MSRKNKRSQEVYKRVDYDVKEVTKKDMFDKLKAYDNTKSNLVTQKAKSTYRVPIESMVLHRGEVYYAELPERIEGSSVQGGVRPVLIIQNDRGNKHSTTVIVAVLTSAKKKMLPTHFNVVLNEESTVLTEQLFTIDKKSIHYKQVPNYVLTKEEMRQLNKCLKISLNLF